MGNVVRLGSDRPRSRRPSEEPRTGARILFFTGVRYCRDEAEVPSGMSESLAIRDRLGRAADSAFGLDVAAH